MVNQSLTLASLTMAFVWLQCGRKDKDTESHQTYVYFNEESDPFGVCALGSNNCRAAGAVPLDTHNALPSLAQHPRGDPAGDPISFAAACPCCGCRLL